MFGKRKNKDIYTMKESYNADDLYLARFKWVSSEVTDFGPMAKETEINYIFEKEGKK